LNLSLYVIRFSPALSWNFSHAVFSLKVGLPYVVDVSGHPNFFDWRELWMSGEVGFMAALCEFQQRERCGVQVFRCEHAEEVGEPGTETPLVVSLVAGPLHRLQMDEGGQRPSVSQVLPASGLGLLR
jgi:hypothetical protein